MPRPARRMTAALAAVLVATLGLPLAPTSADESAEPTVLRVGVPNDLDDGQSACRLRSGSDWNVATIQYDMMWMFGNEDLSAQPGLAEVLRAERGQDRVDVHLP